ncbi:MAG: Cof-type HAD-IIB family hydrolase [Fusobacteriaceae bacterium]
MKIKLIASDIDGTLLRSDRTISEATKNYIQEFKQSGGKFILATGRAYFGVKKILDILNYEGVIITYNGAKIINTKTDEILHYTPVNENVTKKMIELARINGIHLNLYQNEEWYVEDSAREEGINYASLVEKDPIEKNFDSFIDYNMTKILFIAENEKLKELEKIIKKQIGEEVHITYSKKTFLEVLDKKVNKGDALKLVLDSYSILPEECAAFGDELNDKEMLKLVKYGVAMENSNPELKEQVQFITLKNDEDGIIEFLKNL